jgi:ABC-type multidrug transport system fused ATPase/permease subunit
MKYVFKESKRALIALVGMFGGMAGMMAVPILIGVVLDFIKDFHVYVNDQSNKPWADKEQKLAHTWSNITFYCLVMIAVFVPSAIFTMIRAYNFTVISAYISKALSYDLFYFIINKDIEFYD